MMAVATLGLLAGCDKVPATRHPNSINVWRKPAWLVSNYEIGESINVEKMKPTDGFDVIVTKKIGKISRSHRKGVDFR
jgi:hypothetical protein